MEDKPRNIYQIFGLDSQPVKETRANVLADNAAIDAEKLLQLEPLSAVLFGSHIRLPILGLVYQLTPRVEEDVFYGNQVALTLGYDRANTHRELIKYKNLNMIGVTGRRQKLYKELVRLSSAKWSIVSSALELPPDEYR